MRRPIAPNLDDRTFADLRGSAIARIQAVCPEWTDFSASDPGIALVEVFAYLTQTLLYRLNRVPDKQYRAFLGLLGVTEQPPSAATAIAVFRRQGGAGVVEIPRGTRVAADSVVFSTMAAARLDAAGQEVAVRVFHGELVENELVGVGTGLPGLEVAVRQAPIVGPMDDGLDLVVAVETTEAIPPSERAIRIEGKTFRVWRQVESFAELEADGQAAAFVVDRLRGVIQFPPAVRVTDEHGQLVTGSGAMGLVPAAGRAIRVSYRTGGGLTGNVQAGAIVTMRDRIAGLAVRNPSPAAGGREAETLEEALARGPIDFHRLHRAVTARDYEVLARRAGGISRAKAFTKAEIWSYSAPGVVEVGLVPSIAPDRRFGVAELRSLQTEEERLKVQRALDQVKPLGSRCEVAWTNYKAVIVRLTAVVSRQEDRIAVRQRILTRLERLISPVAASATADGWPYGRALRRYDVEGTVRAEPGVLYVANVALAAEQLPVGPIVALAPDYHQAQCWYVGSGPTLYRTLNTGDGWEPLVDFAVSGGESEETISLVRASPAVPGLVAVVTKIGFDGGTRVHVSRDCGDRWVLVNRSNFAVRDIAWSIRDGTPLLLLATDTGLYELPLVEGGSPVQVVVAADNTALGFWSVAVHEDRRGAGSFVAVAADGRGGVFISRSGGSSGSFQPTGLANRDVVTLAVQSAGARAFLWAGFRIAGTGAEAGGAARYELAAKPPADGWVSFTEGWEGGSCFGLGFTREGWTIAGSHSEGVLRLAPRDGARWEAARGDVGLPVRDEQVAGQERQLHPVAAIGVDQSSRGAQEDRILVGTGQGVYRAAVPAGPYEAVTHRAAFRTALRETITLPPTWLFCSGEHEVSVVTEDEAERGS